MTVSTGMDTGGQSRPRISMGALWLALAVIGSLPLFWFGFESLAEAWATAEYSHGPLIPVISAYLFLRQLRQCPPALCAPQDRWPGLVLAAVAILVAMAGNLARIPDIVTYGYILWIGALILTTLGWQRGRHFWPPVVHLVFMLPLPHFIYWQVSIFLQGVSSELGVWFIRLADIPVFLDGHVIDLGGPNVLHVAEACSGLRYLFPVMSFSYVFAVLYRGPLWHKIVLLLTAVPITVVMNSVRIGIIGVMVDNVGLAWVENSVAHLMEGWVIFIVAVMILFGLAWAMQRLQKDPMPLADALDLDFDGIGPQLARGLRPAATLVLAAMALLTAGTAAAWHLVPAREAVKVERDPLVLFPPLLDEWRGGPQRRLEPDIARVLAANDYLSVAYSRPTPPEVRARLRQAFGAQDARTVNHREPPVSFFIAWYDRQTEGSGIHSPEVCIPAGGWEMSKILRQQVEVAGQRFEVNRALIGKGTSRQLVWYWFEQRGRRLTSDYEAKLWTLIDGVRLGRTDGALVRLITPVGPLGEAAAEARLRAFLGKALPELPRFVPGS